MAVGNEVCMDDLRNTVLRRLEFRLAEMANQLNRLGLSWAHSAQTWAPAINVYRCRDGFVVCVDLAGVDRSSIEVCAEPRRLRFAGQRLMPEPGEEAGPPLQILALEIDHGPFAREVVLPVAIEPRGVLAEQRNGLLWIHLPLGAPD